MAPESITSTPLTLAGKIAVVSGSSSGIGAAVAKELSRRGASIAINYPFPSERGHAEEAFKSLEGHAKCIMVEADLSTISGPGALVQKVVEEFGHIDIVVNNAGLALFCPLSIDDEAEFLKTWDNALNLNCRGMALLTRAALKHLSPRDSKIVNICSAASRHPEPNMTCYAGSKGMVEAMTRVWARELPRQYGCTVNCVAPGPVSTPAILNSGPMRDAIESVFESIPVAPRMGRPEEIAYAVAGLCENGSSWINGVYLPVNGGSPNS